ncbi:hypothetical protein FE810_09785 [Thalassotalea litorea]|uniref:RcnB family protein n=1 Tax=Thalassotalea litorea TaxID=2020715 RepID=A0A5R9ITE4_9GAMM|nr:hypothetical protein [Thalassotalea litorea]TLU65198.1 hypothetical protein FE810_09785 [Thalassotalea litorea]
MIKINPLNLVLATVVCTIVSSAHAKNDKSDNTLPKGLEKKVKQGKGLPPGWQKKLIPGEILSRDVYRHRDIIVPMDTRGIVTVRIDGKLIRLIEASREIVEILN